MKTIHRCIFPAHWPAGFPVAAAILIALAVSTLASLSAMAVNAAQPETAQVSLDGSGEARFEPLLQGRPQDLHATFQEAAADEAAIEDDRDAAGQQADGMHDPTHGRGEPLTPRSQRGAVDMGGARVTGVAAGDVSSAASSDAVNGGQLFATNQRLDAAVAQGKYLAVGGGGDLAPALSGPFAVAIGDSAEASLANEGGVAVGSYSRALGLNSVVLGRGGFVDETGHDSFALGTGSTVYPRFAMGLGAETLVGRDAENSVAIGNASHARERDTASFGNDGLRRRLVNVAPGTGTHEATTFAQLDQALATLGGNASLDADGNVIAPAYRMQGLSQDTVGEALSVLDGAVSRTGLRVGTLETQLRSIFPAAPYVHGDGPAQLRLAGADGMVIANVASGVIAAGSRDAVNGGQLHAVQQQLNGRMDGLEQRVDDTSPGAAGTTPARPAAEVHTPLPEAVGSPGAMSGHSAERVAGSPAKADVPVPVAQLDTRALDDVLARANSYTDGAISGLERRLERMDRRYNRMAAMNSAQGAMAMNTAGLQTINRFGAGIGHAEGEAAMAVGYQRVLDQRGAATFSLHGAFTNSGERGVGVGVGVGW